jgi:hypothetical protein
MNARVLVLLCLVIAQISYAQQKVFIGGAFLNVNGIEFQGDEAGFWDASENDDIEGILGLSAGLFVKRELRDNLSASMELRYIRKGSIYGFVSEYGTHAFETMYLSYAEIPLLAGYKINTRNRTFFLESGPAFATLISSHLEYNHLLNLHGAEGINDFRKLDLSWIAEMKFPVVQKWSRHFMLGLRVSHSIVPIHRYYKIYNFDYGAEVVYVFNEMR